MGSDWDRDLADAQVDGAAAERRAARREHELLAAEAIWDDELDAVAGAPARLWCRSGRRYDGRIESCGPGLVSVRTESGLTLIRRDVIVAFEVPRRARVAAGGVQEVGMSEMLAELADRRTPISGWADGYRFVGEVIDVGDDVARVLGADGTIAYVAVRSVTEVVAETSFS